ncbi:semaphorin-4E [Trichomycterus rosablanca]|uniref:semaphorin-4E n=1 Tax=Trichomycterus rosablanca TaxID=2290929 RepID=UPI002F35DE5D
MSSSFHSPNTLLDLLLACFFIGLCTSDCIPRKQIPYESNSIKVFREESIYNYSSILMREDLGLLIVGAREAIYALDINNISVTKTKVTWQVSWVKQNECTYKGKHPDIECRNYIRTLHQINETLMYVCGTNAFNPTCDYIAYVDGQLKLVGQQEEGKGKCPFDPFQRYSSIIVDGDFYSATFVNFLGSEPVILRNSLNVLRTESASYWLNEPNFVYMDVIPESKNSLDGDDDKIYIFFSENAIEYDFYNKLIVSRVARVCKGDKGGQRTLQKKWTSFVKATLECPIPGSILPSVVQDVFHVHHHNWRKNLFYAIFTSQSDSSVLSSVVCAYTVTDINEVFSYGKFKTPVTVDTSDVKWIMYSGEPPVPRPGACINNAARAMKIQSSLDLPDRTLQFIRDRPLMDDTVKPVTGRPLLFTKGISFTRLVVDCKIGLDGQTYLVMFIGTDKGFVQKAVNYNDEMHIIEELQLFKNPEPISVLRLSTSLGQLYAGSSSGVVQMPVADCGHYSSCLDCVLARDPYCAWDLSTHNCVTLPSPSKEINLVQSLLEGDASRCPRPVSVKVENRTLVLGNNIKLPCQQDSNLAQLNWRFESQQLNPSKEKYATYSDGLLIYNATATDAGCYTCESVERVVNKDYKRTLAIYELQIPSAKDHIGSHPTITVPLTTFENMAEATASPQHKNMVGSWVAMQVSLALLSVMMVALLLWNLCMGHLPLQKCCTSRGQKKQKALAQSESLPENTEPLQAAVFFHSNNSYRKGSSMDAFKYIRDESEI